MNNYLLLCLAFVLISVQVCLVKAYQLKSGTGFRSSFVFLLLTGLFSALLFLGAGGFRVEFKWFSLFFALMLAVCLTLNNLLALRILSFGNVATYTKFMMLGNMLLPFLFGVIYLHEGITALKIIALLLLALSLFLPFFGKDREPIEKKAILYYIFAFLTNGLVGVLSKAHQVQEGGINTTSLLFWTFTVVTLLTGILLASGWRHTPLGPRLSTGRRGLLALALLGFSAASGLAFLCELVGAREVSASVQYPIVTGGTMIFSALLGRIFFKEKIGTGGWTEILLAFSGTLLFLF